MVSASLKSMIAQPPFKFLGPSREYRLSTTTHLANTWTTENESNYEKLQVKVSFLQNPKTPKPQNPEWAIELLRIWIQKYNKNEETEQQPQTASDANGKT